MAGDVAFYAAAFGFHVPPDEGVVAPARGLVEELQAQCRLGLRGLGGDDEARRVFVDAMDEAHGGVVGVISGVVAQVPGQGVDQRAGVVAATGVDHEAGGLVDDDDVVVLVGDVEGDVFGGYGAVITWPVEQEGDDVGGLDAVVALDGLAVHVDETLARGGLDAVARGVGQVVDEELVDAEQLLAAVGHDAEVFVELAAFFVVDGVVVRSGGEAAG